MDQFVIRNGGPEAEGISPDCYDPIDDKPYRDSTMSEKKFDDAMAALTLAATLVTITLGFLFNL